MRRVICGAGFAGIMLLFCFAVFAQQGKPRAKQKPAVSGNSQAIAFEVLIIETKGDSKDDRIVDLSGPSDVVAVRIRELDKQGKLDVVDRFRLSAVENEESSVHVGRTKAVVSGRSFSPQRGMPSRSVFQNQQMGTIVSVVARVEGNAVIAKLNVEKSALERKDPDEAGDAEAEIVPPGTSTLTANSTVKIPNGRTVIVGGMQSVSITSSSQRIILVSARVVKPVSGEKVTEVKAKVPRLLKVFPLQNAQAAEAGKIVNSIFEDRRRDVQVSVDERTNSLLIRSEEEPLAEIEAVLNALDRVGK